nr:sigma factor [Thermoanaerobaculia bacterium]
MDVAPERDAQAVAENLSCGLHGAASWAQRWQSGAREEVAREVYGSCRKPVEGYFRSRRCSPEECQELTQAALSRALEGLAGYRGEASFESWLLQIAKSVLHKHLRHAGAAKRSAPTETLEALAGARQA